MCHVGFITNLWTNWTFRPKNTRNHSAIKHPTQQLISLENVVMCHCKLLLRNRTSWHEHERYLYHQTDWFFVWLLSLLSHLFIRLTSPLKTQKNPLSFSIILFKITLSLCRHIQILFDDVICIIIVPTTILYNITSRWFSVYLYYREGPGAFVLCSFCIRNCKLVGGACYIFIGNDRIV